MKQTVAVSLTLQQLASFINDSLAAAAGDTVPWALVLQTDGVAQYVANTSREDGQKLIESLLDRWRAGRADIPAHYNPDLAKPAEDEAPKTEPAAWALAYREDPDDYDHFTTVASTMKRWVEDEDNIAVPLYTHPSEPVELSNEEILAIRDELLPGQGELFDCVAFARAVLAQERKGRTA